MNWIEMTRRSLEEVKGWLEKEQDFFLAHDYKGVAAACIHGGVTEALAAIPAEPEIVTFLKWLKKESEADDGVLYSLALSHEIEEYVWDRFGYKLEDE